MKKELKKETGITLVVLVITIVVLLILAAVVMLTLTGENNIITKAKTSKDNYHDASMNEEDKIAEYENHIENTKKVEENQLKSGNFWQNKGLTSSNVQFGKTYTSTNYSKGGITSATLTIIDDSWTLIESGGQTITMGKSDYGEIDNLINQMVAQQTESVTDEQIEEARQQFYQMMLPVSENSVGYSENGGSYVWMIEFDSPVTANVYYGSYKNEPANNDWDKLTLIGTFATN